MPQPAFDPAAIGLLRQRAAAEVTAKMADMGSNEPLPMALAFAHSMSEAESRDLYKKHWEAPMAKANEIARKFRANTRADQFPTITKSDNALAKASPIDVGTLTQFSSITGGQSLGYVSLDTQMARGTVRPESFTLYNCLNKTPAFQVVDYWAYAYATGGALPGAAFGNYQSVQSGVLSTNAGGYKLNYITLKLAVDGRAITVALAAQNSFVNVAEQENANAALSVLESINWANYWGNPAIYTSQYAGVFQSVPTTNVFDFQEYYSATGSGQGWSLEQTAFNLIYQAAAEVSSYRTYGRITHAFMSPTMNGGLQTLVTGQLNNILNDITDFQRARRGIVINGNLEGMNTSFGSIQFPIDLFITARDRAAQAITFDDGATNGAQPAGTLGAPTSVTVAASGASYSGSDWSGAYVTQNSGTYMYAAANMDANMNESTLAYSATVSGIAAGSAYVVTVSGTSGSSATAAVRLYRSGNLASGSNPSGIPSAFRYIADLVYGTNQVTGGTGTTTVFIDANTHIPGSETIFLLDLDEKDDALDFRYLLPLTRVELFAQNLYMPWAVAGIGAIRVKLPKFHGVIKNIVLTNPVWNPLASNL